MEKKVSKILKEIQPSKREQFAAQRKLQLTIVDDLKNAIDDLDNMVDIYTKAEARDMGLQAEIDEAYNKLFSYKQEIRAHHQEVMDNYDDLYEAHQRVNALISSARDLADQLGVEIQEIDDADITLDLSAQALRFAEVDYDPSNFKLLEDL